MKILYSKSFFSVVLLFFVSIIYAQNTKFKVVLDAGHGGKDYGATYHGNVEKNIALKTVLKVGEILEKDPNITVVYTRNKDVFVELDDRATIANKSKANIFVSMHCNANANTSAAGNETYVMGITRNASNLEVAKKENSVVTLEDDYEIKYEGFDPNSPESVIGISILQEEYRELSVELAAKVQQAFTKKTSFRNRGVKEAGFLVLRKITMPRVLIEMGFVSNKEEGAFLNSDKGQDKLAEAIANSILEYKKEYFISSATVIDKNKVEEKAEDKPQQIIVKTEETKVVSTNSTKDNLVFKVQISASSRDLETSPSNFKGLNNVTKEKGSVIFKYFYEEAKSYTEAKKNLEVAKEKGFNSAFIVAFKNGEKINISEALK
ncbi:N-acetylmuramoyl-L-alanine amidase [uncultured Flavobacterium sp.]|uniref:N-acetylmuramoyl-L-alanine amidase family protein n=1 Tax=uncultured Flavobacterium sp. TaxID=165435 RepID=UPI0030ED6779|tara:strand:+ start:35841 stop:36974 length:1134 start_codon:yes stop_codon:yes gene_type:complete